MKSLSLDNLTILTASVALFSFTGTVSAVPVVDNTDVLGWNTTLVDHRSSQTFSSALKKRAKFPAGFEPGKVRIPQFFKPGSTNFCTDEQKQVIIKHLSYALRVVEHIVDNSDTSPQSRGYLTYIDANGPDDQEKFENVMNIFRMMKTDLTGKVGEKGELLAKCGSSSSCNNHALAHADSVGHGIQFCDSFFKKRSIVDKVTNFLTQSTVPSFDKFKCRTNSKGKVVFDFKGANLRPDKIHPIYEMPVATLIHELSHLYKYPGPRSKIDDCYYGAYAAEYLAKAVPDAAVRNADNYAWFGMTHYIHSLCGDDEAEQPLLRDSDDEHSPPFKDSWEDFNQAKVKYFALSQQLIDVTAQFKEENNRLTDMKVDVFAKEGGATEQDKEALEELERQVQELRNKKNAIDKEIENLGPAGRMNEDTVVICDTRKTRWDDIESIMSGSD